MTEGSIERDRAKERLAGLLATVDLTLEDIEARVDMLRRQIDRLKDAIETEEFKKLLETAREELRRELT